MEVQVERRYLWKFSPNACDEKDLPDYLIKLLVESCKPKPNPKIWRVEKFHFDKDDKIFYNVEIPLNKGIFSELWHPDTYKTGRFKTAGWIFDFSKNWKTYLVNWKYYGWQLQKAPNKSFIRDHAAHKSYILEIVEKGKVNYKEKYFNLKKLAQKLLEDLIYKQDLPDSYYDLGKAMKYDDD